MNSIQFEFSCIHKMLCFVFFSGVIDKTGLVVIKPPSTIAVRVIQNHPIRTIYLFDTVF